MTVKVLVLTTDLPEHKLKQGDIGAVVEVYSSDAFEAEFVTGSVYTQVLEDVYVDESHRGGCLGTALVNEVVTAATEAACYKLIATSRASRARVHEFYEKLGLESYGIEFRMDLD